ncbi:hypothetical protein ROLI_047920 (plasmid) [Roseobacter fucihabitans]|uniref:Uncharacterized protein n=1 Tax=Roseobacter fucihabitans TaxID=1537242 RepID=A0ABZ2C1V1_9RHOB|nr:hypothetical protein [Roseobacter litoralis]MBC6967283.1 hypothetical protein [Roseobacter litoralis]
MAAHQEAIVSSAGGSNDYHQIPVTEKQLNFARQISQRAGVVLPLEVQQSRLELSRWIDANKTAKPTSPFANYPSSKQVGFAEQIARRKRTEVPHECFRDRGMMSKWIDANV